MPFLAPAIAAWVALSVAVMASYFLFVAPNYQREAHDGGGEADLGRGDAPAPGAPLRDPDPSFSQ